MVDLPLDNDGNILTSSFFQLDFGLLSAVFIRANTVVPSGQRQNILPFSSFIQPEGTAANEFSLLNNTTENFLDGAILLAQFQHEIE